MATKIPREYSNNLCIICSNGSHDISADDRLINDINHSQLHCHTSLERSAPGCYLIDLSARFQATAQD